MAVQISGNDITVPRDGTFSRNVSIAGTLTYEDVTNVDSIGLVTARNGIEIGARPGVAASISVDGNMIVSGISTFGGDVQVPDKIIHSGDTDTAIRFPSADTVSVETGGTQRLSLSASETRFNDTGANTDFVVEGDGNSTLLYIDASTDRVCIGDNNPDNIFHVVTSDTDVAKFESGASGATGTSIRLFHNSSSPADNDTVGQILFSGSDDGGSTTDYGTIKGAAQDVTNGSEDGEFTFHTMTAGTSSEKFRLDADGIRIQNLANGGGLTINQLTTTGNYGSLLFNSNRTGDFDVLGMIRGDWNSDSVAEIDLLAGNDTSNKDNGKILFKTQASNAGGLANRMLINEDGQVLIGGTSNAAAPNTNERLILFGNAANNSRIAVVAQHNDDNPGTIIIAKSRSTGNAILGNNDDVGQLDFAGNDGSGYHVMARIMCSAQGHDTSNDDLPSKLRFFTLTENSTTIRERLTIDDEGIISTNSENHAFNVSTTVSAGTNKYNIRGHHSGTLGSTGSGTISFTVWSNGNVENTNNSYGQISDETLKQDIVDASSQWNDIKNIKVRKFRFKDNPTGELQIGVVAQEVEKVSAGLVYETGDVGEEVKAVKYSVLYMKAIKALQEAMTKIEVLETRLNNAGIAA